MNEAEKIIEDQIHGEEMDFDELKLKPIKRKWHDKGKSKVIKDWLKEIKTKSSLWKRNHSPKLEDVGKFNLGNYWIRFRDSILVPIDEYLTNKVSAVVGKIIPPYFWISCIGIFLIAVIVFLVKVL